MSDVERVERARQLRGSLRVPGDKSASHRALMISALASGTSTITGLSTGEDVRATSVMLERLGATHHKEDGRVLMNGPDEGLRPSDLALDCGNSGTTMRLMCGVVSTIPGTHRLQGDASLSTRPMDRVATPLTLMGVGVRGHGDAVTPPLTVESPTTLHGVTYRVPVASAQVKSAVLFAALGADGVTTVTEDVRTRSTTEDMFLSAGVDLVTSARGDGREVTIRASRPRRHDWFIPGDPSQAAFFAVLGAIHPDATLEVLSIDASPERIGYVGCLQRMGAHVRLVEHGNFQALDARSSTLSATEIHSSEIPSVDEVPVLTVAACAATGVTAFRAMGELRHKESDRFAGSMALAASLGARVWSEVDDFFVEGVKSSSAFLEFSFAGGLDHRMVMASAVAGCAGNGVTVHGSSTVSSSYPNFFRDLALLQ